MYRRKSCSWQVSIRGVANSLFAMKLINVLFSEHCGEYSSLFMTCKWNEDRTLVLDQIDENIFNVV